MEIFLHRAQLSGLLITLAFYGFIFYLDNFASYNKLYGSIGTFIALMLWLWITSLIVLVCFEVNVSFDLAEEKQREREKKEDCCFWKKKSVKERPPERREAFFSEAKIFTLGA